MKSLYLLLVCPCLCFAMSNVPGDQLQQQNMLLAASKPTSPYDPTQIIKDVSADIGVTPDQFRKCLNSSANPAGGAIDIGIVANCLQKIKPSITEEQIQASMIKNRPKPISSSNQN